MNNLKKCGYKTENREFTHIYIEEDALNYTETQKILNIFPEAERITISHYKDIFCRKKQDFHVQKNAKQLILAVKREHLIYQGSPVCQSFNHQHFYYTSSMMNCMYDCEYCYLQGMYPSSNVVIFVNLNDIFKKVEKQLFHHDMYLCVSYDTDLAAFEHITGYTKKWIEFVKKCNQTSNYPLSIEIRTKSAHVSLWKELESNPNVILAYTLSPEQIIQQYEHRTPTLAQRLESIKAAICSGYQVRLCFDPMIYCKDWKSQYQQLIDQIYQSIDTSAIVDVSVGTFRVSQDYLKKMRKDLPASGVLAFPYVNDHGFYHYPKNLSEEMVGFLKGKLLERFSEEQLFLWEP